MVIFPPATAPPIRCPHHDALTPERRRACAAQPVPARPRQQLAHALAQAAAYYARLDPQASTRTCHRQAVGLKAAMWQVRPAAIRRHLRCPWLPYGPRLRHALRAEMERSFCPVRLADQAVQDARQARWGTERQAGRTVPRPGRRSDGQERSVALQRIFRDL